ncbi:MAG: CRISPR-associated helicase/endonuclease Cas3 [Planctomycetaceae bacterium]|nr:CRISPR-associated helicase/endonuclease Cas3 [Planctomycetaceae bacterium]
MMWFAHSLPNCQDTRRWEPLNDHLRMVASRAAEFAGAFHSFDWGELAGRWHDVGKYSAAFQAYLGATDDDASLADQIPGRVDHSTAGAQHAARAVPELGRILAYVIAGHHAGLADSDKLDQRLAKRVEPYDDAPASLLAAPPLDLPRLSLDASDRQRGSFQFAFFTRMLFSVLVDADFLATEAFLQPQQATERALPLPTLDRIATVLDDHLAELGRCAPDTAVNRCRCEVLAACRDAADLPPGFFSLTVPTGGGKTLASLAFALTHARRHGLRRIVYAIPFTSIIEQTSGVFRRALKELGPLRDATVLEHHSNLDPHKQDSRHPRAQQIRLAAENWDAPLVVTTNVQLFESLLANRTSRCRKLHRLAGSVIVLDEAQALPVELLRPCLATLRELAADYGVTVVLCTATQPALARRDGFPIGLQGVREIVPEPAKLYQRMRRVETHQLGELDDAELVAELVRHDTLLCIVNTRPHAADLFAMLRAAEPNVEGLFHLSTRMCGAHRQKTITEIRRRLAEKRPCRVISTQLIEAGVDVDFPVVFRATAGLDSIAQAAGRCNREGLLPAGALYLFEPAGRRLFGYLASTAATAREVLPEFADPLDPVAVEQYFRLHYWKQGQGRDPRAAWDDRRVMECFPPEVERLAFDFRTAAERFRFIDDASQAVFVPWGEGAKLIERLRTAGPERWLLRQLQRHSVGLFDHDYRALVAAGDIAELAVGYAVLDNSEVYDKQLGLRVDRPGHREADSMIV